jgi:DNA-binding PadR family transcriptional regulator
MYRHHYGHCGSRGEISGAGRHGGRFGRGRFGGFGLGGRGFGGMDGDDLMRARRMLAQGDLRLIALALIAEAPRHGYELIKLLEEKTGGWYSPSPGMVYPTLTFLEEAGYVTAATEGAKKLYTITDEGRVYLDSNKELIKAVLDRLSAIGERVNRWRRARGERDAELPPLVEAAFAHLRETVRKRLADDAEAESRLVEILARAATELQGK